MSGIFGHSFSVIFWSFEFSHLPNGYSRLLQFPITVKMSLTIYSLLFIQCVTVIFNPIFSYSICTLSINYPANSQFPTSSQNYRPPIVYVICKSELSVLFSLFSPPSFPVHLIIFCSKSFALILRTFLVTS